VDGVGAELSGAITSRVVNGECIPYSFWITPALGQANGIVSLIWQFVIPLAMIVYCYGHILYAISRKSQVSHSEQTAGDQARAAIAARTHMNIVKTLLTVALAFFLCWSPNQIYSALAYITGNVAFDETAYYGTVFVGFLNVCLNPFIYATQHQSVKNRLLALFGLKAGIKNDDMMSRMDGGSIINTQHVVVTTHT